jgi:hypothetical protein
MNDWTNKYDTALGSVFGYGNYNRCFGRTFKPTDISNLYMWIDFKKSSKFLNGTKIIQVNDLSGNNNNLFQTIDANRPTYNNDGSASISVNKCLNSNSPLRNQPFTIFAVINQKTFVTAKKIINSNAGFNGIDQRIWDLYNCVAPVALSSWFARVPKLGDVLNTLIVVGFVFNGISSAQICNNGYLFYVSEDIGNGTLQNLAIGSANAGADSANFDIYNLIVYDKALNIKECYDVQDYLNFKYNGFFVNECYGFGDSLMQGDVYGAIKFLNIVADSYGAYGFNHGYSGTYLLTNPVLDTNMYTQILNHLPYLNVSKKFMLQVGTNDIVLGIVNATWNNNYRSLVRKMLEAGILASNIYLVTPPYYSTRIVQLNLILGYYAQMHTDFGIKNIDCVAPTLAGGGDALLPDTLHPNQAGINIMANTVIAGL